MLAGLRRALTAGRGGGRPRRWCWSADSASARQQIQERVSSITQVTEAPDQSVTDRYTMWAAALGIWREQPLTGVGLKGFPEHRDGHASLALSSGSDTEGAGGRISSQPLLSPHNMYLWSSASRA